MSEEMDVQQVETPENDERHNRTATNASRVHSDLALVPEKLFLPSNDRYMGGFDYRTDEDYYLELIKGIDVCFDESNGELTFNGIPASRVDLTDIETKERITELNTPLLHGLFSVIWFNLIKDIDKVSPIPTKQDEEQFYSNLSPQERMMNPVERWLNFDRWWHQNLDNYGVRVYIPSLMRYLSPNANFNDEKFQVFIRELEKLDRIFGVKRVMVNGKERMIKSRLLVYGEYDQVTNTIKLNSPYINRLVMDMFRDKSYEYKINGKPVLDSAGNKRYLPTVTTVGNPALLSQRDARAVELAAYLIGFLKARYTRNSVKTINIKASNVVGVCVGLREALADTDDYDIQRMLLKRTFTDMWKYLREYSDIPQMYDYKEVIPTVSAYFKQTCVLRFTKKFGYTEKDANEK